MIRKLRQLLCRHSWRPVTVEEGHGARWCEKCGKLERLSDAEFYTHFGRIPRIGAA